MLPRNPMKDTVFECLGYQFISQKTNKQTNNHLKPEKQESVIQSLKSTKYQRKTIAILHKKGKYAFVFFQFLLHLNQTIYFMWPYVI